MSPDFPIRSAGRAALISLGCAKNLVDSEHLTAALLDAGFTVTPQLRGADLLLINTCAFIREAREESSAVIREACQLKRAGDCRAVLVVGCMAQRYRRRLLDRFPEVDGVLGLDELDRVGEAARRVLEGEGPVVEVGEVARRLYEPAERRVVLSGGPYAYLKIAEGCAHRCRFCAIPAIRGPFRSRPISAILREAETLLERGFRELNLIAQDTTGYGHDRRDGTDLIRLLQALDRLPGRFWIRVLYGYPTGITEALLETVAQARHMVPYFDVPIQHADPEVLRQMGRGATAAIVPGLTARIRRLIPEAVVRTTCLVGHPGESEKAFERLLAHIEEAAYDHLGVFVFSPEEGTPAARLRPRPSRPTAERRRERLLEVQIPIARARLRARRAKAEELLVEAVHPARVIGRCRGQAPEVDGQTWLAERNSSLRPGMLIPIRLTGRYRGADWEAERQER